MPTKKKFPVQPSYLITTNTILLTGPEKGNFRQCEGLSNDTSQTLNKQIMYLPIDTAKVSEQSYCQSNKSAYSKLNNRPINISGKIMQCLILPDIFITHIY